MKNKNIYPHFGSTFKCIDTYKDFVQATTYKITAFGTDKRGANKYEVWWIIDLDTQKEFTVIKTTLNKLIDKGILKEYYEM